VQPSDRASLLADFRRIRALSHELCAPLRPEDWRVQSMPDVSPPWWNLGHTSWFFARNVLREFADHEIEARSLAEFDYVLNSYYFGLGPRLARDKRGAVARPTTAEVLRYRASVDEAMGEVLETTAADAWPRLATLTTIGLHHEQQHQELLLSEILHIRWSDPDELRVPYRDALPPRQYDAEPPSGPRFVPVSGGLVEIGADGTGFAWDNELPRHRAFVDDFEIGARLVTCGEWLAFVEAGGYRQPLLWLSNGWDEVRERGWQAPLYWQQRDGTWFEWTLRGFRPLDPSAPVGHVSFYEAEAYARWAGARLPTEREWELAAGRHGFTTAGANLLPDGLGTDDGLDQAPLHTLVPARSPSPLLQLAGDVWEWTTSHYEPYPGYRPFDGALTEYNGKFMDNQRVLRGGSFATPRAHVRPSYRNFWPANTRFQFTGVRLAR
jgi:ergothioneine biosynthesis protein EgtB